MRLQSINLNTTGFKSMTFLVIFCGIVIHIDSVEMHDVKKGHFCSQKVSNVIKFDRSLL